jgi:nitrate/nitrite transporter NarK
MARTMEQILAWKIMPRLMMLVMTIVYIRCIEWALTQPDLSTQQASLVSVVTGAMTGSFAVWLGSERKEGK